MGTFANGAPRFVSTVESDNQLAMARELWRQSRNAEAEAVLRGLMEFRPNHEDTAVLLAGVLRSQGRLSAASQVMLDVCEANGFEPSLCLRAAGFAQQCDRHAIAAQICQAALARGGVPPELLALTGHVAREAGDFETARARYIAALDAGIDLDTHHVLGALANTRRYTDADSFDIVRFSKHFSDSRYSPRSRASAGFALAKAQDDLADYAAASATLRQANAMVHAASPWSVAAWRGFVAGRQRETAVSANGVPDDGFVPVFVVGLPRSGTTLTSTLLARASGARDRGEFRALRFIADQIVAGRHLGNPGALAEAANLYRTLAVQDDARARWYIDQDPLNFRYLDIAAAMFPQARVIHLRRDSRDTALSLWSQDFAHADLAFAYDFDDIAACMEGHDALMRHWKQSLRVPIHELDYETVVTDTEATVASLCDFIGAPADGSRHSEESAPVQSASVWQARQPVYKTSVGRWRHYASYVPELRRFRERIDP
jgi:tetratricopeptide (TPR) repeat protein